MKEKGSVLCQTCRVEALMQPKKKVIKCKVKIPIPSKNFSTKKFEKKVLKGLQEVQDYYKIPCISHSITKLRIDLKEQYLMWTISWSSLICF